MSSVFEFREYRETPLDYQDRGRRVAASDAAPGASVLWGEGRPAGALRLTL